MSDLSPLSDAALDRLFRQARTVHAFQPVPVSDATLHQLYDLLKWGPTAFNAQPARYVFVRSAEAKAKLLPAVSKGNLPSGEDGPAGRWRAPGRDRRGGAARVGISGWCWQKRRVMVCLAEGCQHGKTAPTGIGRN